MRHIVSKSEPVLLVGGGMLHFDDLDLATRLCGPVVGVDGGADRLLAHGMIPDWVIGDFDSVSDDTLATIPPDRQIPIAEQDSTDFEKALARVEADLLLCLGFTGSRIDHELAAYNALSRYPQQRAIVLGDSDICLHVRRVALDLPVGSRLSLFPMSAVSGRSEGLEWPIAGLRFAPDGRIGTSNRVTGPVTLEFDSDGMLLILPKTALRAVLAAAG